MTATLSPSAVAILKEYSAWRGKLHDREAQLFLTWRREPYCSGKNKTGFAGKPPGLRGCALSARELRYV